MNNQILSLPSWMKKFLNKLEEAVSENIAYSSSMQSKEVNVCLSSTSETRSSVQALTKLCQTANCTININTAKFFQTFWNRNYFLKYFPVVFCRVCFVTVCNKIYKHRASV